MILCLPVCINGFFSSWVASTNLPADEQAQVQTGFPLYDPSKSTTNQPFDGENFNIAYGDGSGSSGPVAREQVNIGGAIVPDMPIGVADSLHLGSGQTSRNSDGPVGLAFKYGNSSKLDSITERTRTPLIST